MKQSLRHLIRSTLRQLNFELRKFPGGEFRAAPIFDLAVTCLMAQKGPNIKFVQVGANDGVHVDPIRKYIIHFPWEGLLIEPQPAVFNRLVQNYSTVASRLQFANCAVSSGAKSVTLYCAPDAYVGNPQHGAAVVSLNAQTTARQLGLSKHALASIQVPCFTLDSLLSKHSLVEIDLLQIDVEGHDLEVLRSISLEQKRPSLIQFESGHLSPADCRAAANLLVAAGYSLFWGGHQGDALAMSHDFCSRL